jgi:hypothetical protein
MIFVHPLFNTWMGALWSPGFARANEEQASRMV